MEGGKVDEEQEWRDRGALRGPDLDRPLCAGSALKDQGAGAFREEEGDPVDHV